MKNIVKGMMLLFLFAFFVFNPTMIKAWDDCPRGMVNDEFPGDCPKYIDTDGNRICDHSEPAPEDRENQSNLTIDNNQEKYASEVAKSSLPKPLLALVLVLMNLIGILFYSRLRKLKSENI